MNRRPGGMRLKGEKEKERGNVFEDTGIGRALADVLGQPSNFEKQSFAEQRSGRVSKRTDESKKRIEEEEKKAEKERRQKQQAAKRLNELEQRGQEKGRVAHAKDELRYAADKSNKMNMRGKRRATGERKPMPGADYWETIFGQMEDMGAMPDDKTPTEEVLAPENSSAMSEVTLSPEEAAKIFVSGKSMDELLEAFNDGRIDFGTYIAAQEKELRDNPDGKFAQEHNAYRKDLLGSQDDEEEVDTSAESKAYWNEKFDELADMEPEPDMNRPVDEGEFAEFMENRPEFMIPAGDPLSDFNVYVDDDGKTRVRESIDKIAGEQVTPQMASGPATLSTLFANLFDPVSKAIEDLYTKSRLSNSQAEKYEIMDEIEDLQKLQGPERAERYSGPGATRRLGERRDKTSDRNVPQRILNQMRAAQMRK